MADRSIHLPEHLNSFLDREVAEGRFPSADAAVSAGLELLEREQAEYGEKLAWLQQAAQDSIGQIERGEGIQYASLDDLLDGIHRIGEEVRAEADARAA